MVQFVRGVRVRIQGVYCKHGGKMASGRRACNPRHFRIYAESRSVHAYHSDRLLSVSYRNRRVSVRKTVFYYDRGKPVGRIEFRRADAGVRMSLGIEWRRLLLRAGYDLGCRNLLKRDYTLPSDPDGDLAALHFNTLRSRNLFIGIGYRF